PNAYSLPPPSTQSDIVTAPKYTMAGRQDGFIITKNPGPADYSVGSPDVYMTGAPKYTMGVAIPDRKYADYPGPLTYRPESCQSHLPNIPKFTMGIKHSPYKGEFAIKYNDEF
uniref:Uncharacterized protein n=2 Tax=Trichobilharzia regenti TaxID=157069 RepID=A0AA85J406_TRIRE